MAISTYDNLIKRLQGFIDNTSAVLQSILTVIADKIDELDTEIQGASEVNQPKKKLRQILKEWGLQASPVCSVENLQNILRHRYDYHSLRGSETGILNDIDLLCNSGANIYKIPPPLEWYLDISYPFWGEDLIATYFDYLSFEDTEAYYYGLTGLTGYFEDCEDSPLDYSDACFGYLIDLGFAIRFAIDNNMFTGAEIKAIIRKNSIPVHLDVYLDVVDDSYNYLMLEHNLGWL